MKPSDWLNFVFIVCLLVLFMFTTFSCIGTTEKLCLTVSRGGIHCISN